MATLSRFHDDLAFMTCILRVNVRTPGWQKAVRGVLRSSKGVRSFRMDEDGTVEVSGIGDPKSLLKKLGKAGNRAQLRWFQYGQCSDNLFLPNQNSGRRGYGGDGRMYYPFHGGGYGGCRHSSLPACEYGQCYDNLFLPNQNYGRCGYGGDGRMHYPFHGGGYGGCRHSSLPACEYDHSMSYVTTPSYGESVGCCCLM